MALLTQKAFRFERDKGIKSSGVLLSFLSSVTD